MKSIFEVLQDKEEQLREKKLAVKMLEEQITKLRGAIEIFKEVLQSEEAASVPAVPASMNPGLSVVSGGEDPLNLNSRHAASSMPSRNWP
jgi:gamma-glutamyl:cysteine ligase YbdK (ATP-grasp superfamily)